MHLIKVVLLLLILFITSNAKELKKITLQLSWFDQFQFAGYYIAKEKGFYENLGLDVEIKPFDFGINVPQEVDEKRADFGIGRETLILEKAAGKNIVALYALFQATPLILLTTEENNINKIEDFVNKRIMTTSDDSSEVSIKAMISSKKVKLDNLNFLKHTHNVDDLINKNTDVMSAYISKFPYDLTKRGIPFKIFDPKDYGFDMYSDMLFTNNDLLNSDIDTVMAFKKASLRGWEYAYSNIEETAGLIYEKYNSQNISKEALIYEGTELKKLSYHNTNILGEIKAEKVQRIYDLYNIMGLIPKPIDTIEFVDYSNDNKKMFLTKEEKAYLSENKNFKMCIVPNIKPYSFIENNEFKGFVADYFKIIEEKTGIEFELIKSDTFKESLELFQNKKCDIFTSLENTPDRNEFANFTKAYSNIPFVLISRFDFPFVDSLSSLKNKKIGLIGSYSISKKIKKMYPNLEFVDVKDLEEGIDKVLKKEIDGHFDLLYTSLYALYDNNSNNKLKVSNKLDVNVPISIAIRNDDKNLYTIFNRVVDEIDDKKVDSLIKSWINIEYKKSTDYTLLWQVLLVIGVMFLAFLYKHKLLHNMNKSLNNIVKEKTEELIKINQNLEKRIKKEVEENLKKDNLLQRQAKMAAMGEMLENIAHQWRQPLSTISTGASGIKIKKELNSLDDKFLFETVDSIVNSTLYLSETIEDFRNFFKPNKEKKRFCLSDCIEKSLNIVSSKFENENIKIVKNIKKMSILGHESELIQVFVNILNNARDALISSTTDNKFIFIEVSKSDSKIVIKIKDNAGGIDPLIIDKIFDPYFTTKHKSQGTGIGLYMSHQIVSKHMNGLIEATNSKYKYENNKYIGALFTITFYDE